MNELHIFQRFGLLAAMLALIGCVSGEKAADKPSPQNSTWDGPTITDFSYDDYADTLSRFVDSRNLVDYQGLKDHREQIDAFRDSLGRLSPQLFSSWTDAAKIAFWINAYNALTLVVIADHYPIEASLFRSVVFPKNSIRQISGVWDSINFTIMGEELNLDAIEHKILRSQFQEPRIHMALVCAALSCPPLRNEPFVGERLEQQLDDQTRQFLANVGKFRIDRQTDKVYLSPILKWFAEDFETKYAVEEGFGDVSKSQRAVLNFVQGYLSDADRDYLMAGGYDVEYLDYDWTLNEQ